MQMNAHMFVPLGYQQITSLGTAVGLTIPAGATHAFVNAEVANVRWRDDGTAPTASVGMLLEAEQSSVPAVDLFYAGTLSQIKFIAVSGSPKLNISYYRVAG